MARNAYNFSLKHTISQYIRGRGEGGRRKRSITIMSMKIGYIGRPVLIMYNMATVYI